MNGQTTKTLFVLCDDMGVQVGSHLQVVCRRRDSQPRSGGMPPFDIIFMGWCHGTKESKMTPAKDQTSVPELIPGSIERGRMAALLQEV